MEEKNKEKSKQMRTAVALQYEKGEQAPKIVASGRGAVAERIIDAANDADVPLYEDAKLAKTLAKLEIGDMIPEELYGVVAEILVFVDRMDKIKHKVL